MSNGKVVTLVALVATVALLVTSMGLTDGASPSWAKGAMCIACHNALSKAAVARYKKTKHAKAKILANMKPVDIYRRSIGLAADGKTYYEAGVGCQACHGPGLAHLKAKMDQKKATMPRLDQLKTVNQKLTVCGRCHGAYTYEGRPYLLKYKPGDDMLALEGFKLDEITKPGPFQQLNELKGSKHATDDISCITCHTAHEEMTGEHQLRKPVPDLCLQCHADEHPCTVSPEKVTDGATCVTCHMPDGRHVFAVAAAQ